MSPATRLRLFYLAYYGGVGAYLPYFAPYLRGLGYSGEQIGTVQMVGPLVAVPAALGWAAAADRMRDPARALRWATAWSLLALLALPFATAPLAVGAILLLHGLGDRAVVPLVDSVTVEWSRHHGTASYARIRLFGSLGYALLATAAGLWLTARGARPGDRLVPILYVACVAGYALLARGLPSPPPAASRPRFREMAALLGDRRLLVLLLVCAVHWAATAPYHLMTGLLVRDLGLPPAVTGLAMTTGVAAEVAALLAFPRIASAAPLRTVLAVAFAASALRWGLVWRAGSATAVVLLQLFHFFTFGLFWAAAVEAMSRLVPSRLRATGQAVFAAVVFGAGNAVGYQLSGLGYDRFGGAAPLFAGAGVADLVALALALLVPAAAFSGGPAGSAPAAPSAGPGTAPPSTPRR